ncbi:MAG: SUKH-3 domain-containing protein [Methanimicrococcus sp.]|nr:SUKH-3 domain-containing protein [Methanimicrococcus sp.]
MTVNLSRDIAVIMEKYGWNPKRRIDTAEIVKILSDEGYQLNKYALEVIEQFGNLELEHPSYKIKNQTEKLHFNPLKACEGIYREKVEEYESRIGESLVVIGEAYNEHLTLMVSDNGSIYGGYDDFLVRLGNSIEDALETIYYSKEVEEIS